MADQKDTKYLFKRDHHWWVKIAVPRSLRDALGYDLRRSLHTSDLDTALAARDAAVQELRGRIAEAREQAEAGDRPYQYSPDAGAAGHEVTRREDFSDVTYLLEIHHPMLARAAAPGQFVIVISHERGERIPLTIADYDEGRGTITLVVQAVGKTTREMQQLCTPGFKLFSMVGPMGIPTDLGGARKVVCVGGGLGVAPIYPQLRAFKNSGAYVIGVVGFRNRELAFWEDKFREYCDEFIICTDDGSSGIKGLVTDGIELAMKQHDDIDRVVAIGPPIMMRACAETTRSRGIETTVSLNPIMVDGTGMCGGCRVQVAGETKFACVDGPEFNAHDVDFEDLMGRLRRFTAYERQAVEVWEQGQSPTESGATPRT
ncbi:MAG: sulfide/dihydroorotate dehydrogenase-like FAD/NAD-binding protein [Pseudomonadales bacterium]|jgi:NAD(P)H-flavin reductase|nr:sulfide/dihydroorotate dehydrogenase-like FAD/NAD-binding protein [Pseudomonadales bacterium]MDP6471475.1 sulfide/dihydroorotate dehydrogenase-like FAD/NAD-binding protein [Pseudomonadales bacterium]MDP6828644.1 sulfide/dihydroorotate dehydrogenase-like FAD/NAD-binding protein [Pseudomonadales bacterium]MDP6972363.1 sulfide/dihydroorotate dehydrogenase-like FAD/NAD-binding protein [Pseudomonadales bacterium]|tara:strand:- start:499 stop:1617 length:1119 start_codon:yes stop_codon:yes gene_type:complete